MSFQSTKSPFIPSNGIFRKHVIVLNDGLFEPFD